MLEKNNVQIIMNELTPQEYKMLLSQAKWGDKSANDVTIALENSLVTLKAVVNGFTVACARVVGDGKLCFYIQDVIVHSNYRRKGIASLLLSTIEVYFKNNACHGAFIGLMAAKDKEVLYEKFAFNKRPNELMGCGMVKFWGCDSLKEV